MGSKAEQAQHPDRVAAQPSRRQRHLETDVTIELRFSFCIRSPIITDQFHTMGNDNAFQFFCDIAYCLHACMFIVVS